MTGRDARLRLVEIAGAARRAGVPASRSARLAARTGGKPISRPSLRDLKSWPSWPGAERRQQERVWRIAALIAAHDAVGEVIDGEVLRSYAEAVGDGALEAILALPAGGNGPLAPPSGLAEHGRQVAERGLPAALAAALGVAALHSETDRDHIVCAERIAREVPA